MRTHAAAQRRAGTRPAGLALCFHWSNPRVKDRLASLRSGRAGYWGRPSDEPEEYRDGLHSEAKVEEFNTKTGRTYLRWKAFKRTNYAFDLECMALVLAMLSGILAQPEPPPSVTAPA